LNFNSAEIYFLKLQLGWAVVVSIWSHKFRQNHYHYWTG